MTGPGGVSDGLRADPQKGTEQDARSTEELLRRALESCQAAHRAAVAVGQKAARERDVARAELAESSSGRTAAFEAVNLGSTPSSAVAAPGLESPYRKEDAAGLTAAGPGAAPPLVREATNRSPLGTWAERALVGIGALPLLTGLGFIYLGVRAREGLAGRSTSATDELGSSPVPGSGVSRG